MSQPDSAPGFFGKVTSHGDFVSRRLPPAFLEVWDNWLQDSIQTSKRQLDNAWLETYLTSPIWRFALSNGVIDGNAWAGVMMPSVDRVGRHFPLMIAAGVPVQAPLLNWLENGKAWYDGMEELALSSLESNFLLDDFDAALKAKPVLFSPVLFGDADTRSTGGWCLPSQGNDSIQVNMSALTADMAQALLSGHSLWWTDGSPHITPSVLMCKGLPEPTGFVAMLDGSWREWGWRRPALST
ncbi:type VI secretion system-associated protein TagF [Undibacterium terreum]|uniref:Type VI secretion-associated protein n=1 Tax=Undibacterium terreum TaxID=1224302 RepID=A0A916UPC1_9BURK|nr:type VI secretion system-associated protein TagF [Undibacterium terreum]GGC78419.1 type VI secretion-associated protein [Undibacterium terreum]